MWLWISALVLVHTLLGFWKMGEHLLTEFVDTWVYLPNTPQEVHRPWKPWRVACYISFSLLWLPLGIAVYTLAFVLLAIVFFGTLAAVLLEKEKKAASG